MKVLQMLPSLDVGGVERGVIDLVRSMKRRGEASVVISSGGPLVTELQKLGIPHYQLSVHKKSLLSLGLVSKIAEIIRREQIDLVHARSRVPAWLAWLACRQTGVPFVTTCHGYYSTHLLSRIMGWGKRVIVISKIIGRHMIDNFGVNPERIRLIHRGVDLSFFLKGQKKKDVGQSNLLWKEKSNPSSLKIINIGRFSPIKGQIEFLKAIHLLRRRFPHIEVWLVGSEGKGKNKYTEEIKDMIQQLGLQSCVQLLGTRRDIPDLLAQSDLLVLSTLVPEAFGRVLIEAGAVGTAVLATRTGGVLDIVEHEKNGLLVTPGDPQAMAEGMESILSNQDLRRRLAERLHEKVCEEFSLEKMVDKILAVYRETLREKKILFVKLGAMGDVILSTPSLRMIRRRFPEASLSMLIDRRLSMLVSSSPYLDEVIPIDRHQLSRASYFFKAAKKIRKEGFEISVDLQNSKWTHLLAFFSGIRERYGFRRGKFGFLLNRPDRGAAVRESPVLNQFRILTKLGIHELSEALEVWSDEESENRARQMIAPQSEAGGSKLVGMVMGSSERWVTKRWPLAYYEALAKKLMQACACRIVLLGSREDAVYAQSTGLATNSSVINLMGKTTVQDLVPIVGRLDLLITGDTAPLHIANAVGTLALALFGPTDPTRHTQPGSGTTVIIKNLECQPCYEGSCRQEDNLACLRQITVEEVFDVAMEKLRLEIRT